MVGLLGATAVASVGVHWSGSLASSQSEREKLLMALPVLAAVALLRYAKVPDPSLRHRLTPFSNHTKRTSIPPSFQAVH